MANIKDYLKYYKNEEFSVYPFNDIDNILFAQLSYIDWTNIVPEDREQVTLNEAIKQYLSQGHYADLNQEFFDSIIYNLNEIQDSKRYKDCKLSYYRKELDGQKQFGAVCIHFGHRTVYVSFQGTDNSISGWKENFEMSYKFPIPAQESAVEYLNEVIGWNENTIYLGGHSKGGNLAMVAYMYCKKIIKNKIKIIFNNDGPGFMKENTSTSEYEEMVSKLRTFIPEESLVGRLLVTSPNYKVIKSDDRFIMQHNCNTWNCFGTFFVEGELTKHSNKISASIQNLVENSTIEEKKIIISTLFEILEKHNITDVTQLMNIDWQTFVKLFNEMKNTNPRIKKMYLESLKKLL